MLDIFRASENNKNQAQKGNTRMLKMIKLGEFYK